jgi:hypothetical protein
MKPITKHGAGIGSFLFAFLLFPYIVLGNIEITEIMYDLPGSDAGREWIEITNTGQEALDIGKYKLFENGTNHGLKVVAGSSTILPNGSAVIAADAQKFLLDWPSYSGTLFDSAFSLSNSGESLAIKDASLTTLDTVAYVAVGEADGTGGSLHKTSGSFVAAMPTPGIFPGERVAVPKKEKLASPAPTTKKSSTQKSSSSIAAVKPVASSEANTKTAAVAETFIGTLPPYALWLLALAAVILVGIAGIFFVLAGKKETYMTADEFKIE